MEAPRALRSQARLLRTYGGPGGGGRRRRGRAAPWFSPPRERRHLFSSSSSGCLSAGSPGVGPGSGSGSGSGSSSPASDPDSDPDFELAPAPGERRLRMRLRGRARADATPARAEADATPARADATPAWPERTPAWTEADQTPARPERTPAWTEADQTPARPEQTPARPERTPAWPERTPARPERTPAWTEADQTPARPERTPARAAGSRPRAEAPLGHRPDEEEDEEAAAKENRPHRFVTERPRGLRARARRRGPQLFSTPGPSPPPDLAAPEEPAGRRTPRASRGRLSRSILAGLSPVRNVSPGPAHSPAAGDSLATSASLFSPVREPEEPRRRSPRRPRRKAAKPALAKERAPTALPDCSARKACISGFSAARWKKGRPPPAGPSRRPPGSKRPRLSEGRAWAKARASLSLHKKVVAEGAGPGTPCGSLLLDSSGPPSGAPWQTSSLYMLTPNKSLPLGDLVLSDAEKVYRECQQEEPLPFDHYLSSDQIRSCEKIGEGVFGEVYRTVVDNRSTALKVIAIEGAELVNGSPQKTFGEVLAEIIISKELSLLSEEAPNRTDGFIGLYAVRCVRGAYPKPLLQAWDAFSSRRGTENQRPDFFGPDQLYVVLEFEFGGVDLERMRTQLSSVATAKSLLHQVTAALAVAEAALRFEHRDLHWGNVLVKRTGVKALNYTLDGQPGTIATHGIHVSIIDYTLSRLEKDGLVVFCDLSDERELFQGQGDYQFDIYRLMKKRTRNRWAAHEPYCNVLWLHYLADKVLKKLAFKKKVATAPMRHVKRQIQAFHDTVLGFESATELLQKHSLFR